VKRALVWVVAALALLAMVGWTVVESTPHRFAFLDETAPLSKSRSEMSRIDLPHLGFHGAGTTELAIYRLPGTSSELLSSVRDELASGGWYEDDTIQRTAIWFIRKRGAAVDAVIVSRREPALTLYSVRPESLPEKVLRLLGR